MTDRDPTVIVMTNDIDEMVKQKLRDPIIDRMPACGECWRHYEGALVTIVGIATDDSGNVNVVYTEYSWSSAQQPPLSVRSLGNFLQRVYFGTPRFMFDMPAGCDPNCRYINQRKSEREFHLGDRNVGGVQQAKSPAPEHGETWPRFVKDNDSHL